MEEQTNVSDHCTKQPPQDRGREIVNVNGKYECVPCEKTFSRKDYLTNHIQSKHEGVKYACDQCDYQATQKRYLKTHIHNMHKIVS